MDLPSQTWKKLNKMDDGSYYTTASIGVNRCVILTKNAGPACHLRLESKSLQQLASQIIYKHRSELSWQCLPSKTIAQLGLYFPEASTYSVLHAPDDSDAATDEVKDECPICLHGFSEKEDKMTLDCGHVFCKYCIQMWFEVKQEKTCPSCGRTYI